MNILKRLKKHFDDKKSSLLNEIAKEEADRHFNIEYRNGKTCIVFKGIVINLNDNNDEAVKTLFELRKIYFDDRISNKI